MPGRVSLTHGDLHYFATARGAPLVYTKAPEKVRAGRSGSGGRTERRRNQSATNRRSRRRSITPSRWSWRSTANELEELLRLARGERGGGLVEDHRLCPLRECPGHRDQLLLSGAERSHGPFRRDPQAHLREQRPPLGWSL